MAKGYNQEKFLPNVRIYPVIGELVKRTIEPLVRPIREFDARGNVEVKNMLRRIGRVR